MIMQSSYKGRHPHYIEEIQRDLKVCLENTKHIILMGYSLPQDDVTWRSILAARKNREPSNSVKCTVIVGHGGPDKWLYKEELDKYLDKVGNSGFATIQSAKEIFELDNIRAYTHGIPQVWQRGGDIAKNVRQILNWSTDDF